MSYNSTNSLLHACLKAEEAQEYSTEVRPDERTSDI